jgi:RHS repeat-associated protein
LKPGADLIEKASLEADGNADGPLVIDEPVTALGINEGHHSITADYSDSDNTRTLVSGGPQVTAEEYGNAPSANDIGGELLAEHPAGAAPNAPQKEYGYRGGLSPITAQSGGVVTLYPSANQSPDPGQVGTLAVTDISNAGHGSTLTGVSAFDIQTQPAKNNTQQRSARWSSFQTGPAGVVSLKLKFDWTTSGNVNASVEVGGSAYARIDSGISYSLDGGSSWTNALSRFRQVSQSGEGIQGDGISEGGSVEVILSPSQNISLVQVRDFMKANAAANAPGQVSGAIAESGAGITTSVSNIRLEVDTAPVISNVAAGGITASSATITWNTNENSDSQVEYGTTTAYGQSTTLDPAIVTAHSQGLSGLASGTLYHYRVKSRDAAGNLAVSGDFSFTTAPDTTPPTVASFSPAAGAANVNANANVTVTFSEAMNAATVNGSTVELRDPSNALVSATVSYNAASLTATLDPTAPLTAGATYTTRVRGGGTDPRVKDVAGNALAADVTWAFTTAQNGSGEIKWLVTDHLGSTRMVIDETGSLAGIKRHDFAPFGEELYADMGIRIASLGYSADSTRQKFTGKERDDETGLDYFEARYFSSIQGRFTSTDPITVTPARVLDPQQLNLYAYVRNNPLSLIDPTGMIIDTSRLSKEELEKYKQIVELANAKDKDGNYVNPKLHEIYDKLNTNNRTFFVENRSFGDRSGTVGEFHITKFEGNDFSEAVIQLDFKKVEEIGTTTNADLVPGFKKYEGLLGDDKVSKALRLAELFGHEGAHGAYALGNVAETVKLERMLNDRDAAMKAMPKGARYPYPPDVMQKIDAAEKAMIPSERFAQQTAQIINGELRAGKQKKK